MRLLQSQKNELYDLINKFNYFAPSQFAVSQEGNIINFTATEYYFRIFENEGYHNSFFVNFSPGKTSFTDASSSIGWTLIKGYFFDWLGYLQREITAPDKWKRLADEISYLISPVLSNHQKFEHDEYLELSKNINQIKDSLKDIPLLQNQFDAFQNQLDHLLSLAIKLNKYDWQNLFVGTIISIIIQLNVTQDNAQLLYQLIKRVFHNLILK